MGKKLRFGGRKTRHKGTRGLVVTRDELTIDTEKFLEPVAKSAAKALQEAIRNVEEPAADATVKARQRMARTGKWPAGRYPGPPPNTRSEGKLFNDSGYLADNLKIVRVGDGFNIVAPEGRFGALLSRPMRQKFQEFVDTEKAMESPEMSKDAAKALGKSVRVKRKVRRGS